jgi:hypothetical protein
VIDLDKEQLIWRRSKLRVAIVKNLQKRAERGRSSEFVTQVRLNLYWARDAEFDSVVAELMAEGVLEQITGRDGGAKLQLITTEATNV